MSAEKRVAGEGRSGATFVENSVQYVKPKHGTLLRMFLAPLSVIQAEKREASEYCRSMLLLTKKECGLILSNGNID